MSLVKLLAWRDIAGPFYGSEDQAVLLYSLVKMYRPRAVLELGTGLGVSSYWIAQALKENGEGQLLSVDDGSHWNEDAIQKVTPALDKLLRKLDEHPTFSSLFPRAKVPHYFDWLNALARTLELDAHVSFVNESLDLSSLAPRSNAGLLSKMQANEIELLYADFTHGPDAVLALLAGFLPNMARSSSILIDSASTLWLSYFVLEQTVAQLNSGKVPAALLVGANKERRERMMEIVATRKFTLVHLVERKDRSQNGLAWLKIEPVNVVPYPLTAMRSEGKLMPRTVLEWMYEP
jgi:hypothetical protein